MGIARTGAANQRDSDPSHSMLDLLGRSLKQRVGGSSPPRHTTSAQFLCCGGLLSVLWAMQF
jgi:hypothetical protein